MPIEDKLASNPDTTTVAEYLSKTAGRTAEPTATTLNSTNQTISVSITRLGNLGTFGTSTNNHSPITSTIPLRAN